MQRLDEPLVPHEVTGHVHVPVVHQDPVLLQKEPNFQQGHTWNSNKPRLHKHHSQSVVRHVL